MRFVQRSDDYAALQTVWIAFRLVKQLVRTENRVPNPSVGGKCWAACLGDCSDRISREHLVSESLFPDQKIGVSGFDWCKGQDRYISISGLTSKILCEHHNNALSPVDEEGARAYRIAKEMVRLSYERGKQKAHRWNIKRLAIDGPKMERWFLKTLINLSYERGHPIGRDSRVPGRPSDRLVRVAYGMESFR